MATRTYGWSRAANDDLIRLDQLQRALEHARHEIIIGRLVPDDSLASLENEMDDLRRNIRTGLELARAERRITSEKIGP